jgi:uncharacterized membrane protein YgdD (TMEM256/DUF423 family)
MFKKFLWLEWKAFTRSSSFGINMTLKIILGVMAFIYSLMFLFLSGAAYYGIKEELHQDPLVVVSKYLVYYFLADMVIRALLQKVPVLNTRPLLALPIKRSTIINFVLGKTFLSFFCLVHVFLMVPFNIVLLIEGYDPLGVIFWWLGLWLIVYINNLANLLMGDNDFIFIIFLGILASFVGLQYYGYFDVTLVTGALFHSLYSTYFAILIPVAVFAGFYWFSHKTFSKKMYLDTGLKSKSEIADGREYTFLNRFGVMGTFLRNDLRLILRNKRSRTTLIMSFVFIFYGFLFFSGAIDVYDNVHMKMFAAIFITGGFMMTFGQFVPSWDSAYYPLMMSQNIPYSQYIASKWWLMVVAVCVSSIVGAIYLYFGIETYLMILSGAVFNIGVNTLLVLLGGAYVKTPIDLASAKQAFGNKQAFNLKVFLISLPKLLLPMLLYTLGAKLISPLAGFLFVTGAGLLGLIFRKAAFRAIERIYKTEKYDTIAAYKEKN